MLGIDLGSLSEAMTVNDPDTTAYLNLETGVVVLVSSEYVDVDDDLDQPEWSLELIEQAKEVQDFPDRFLEVDSISSHESYTWMKDFIETQPEEFAAPLLDAINERKPFRRFRDALDMMPDDVLQAWYSFRDTQELEYASNWLRLNSIEFNESKIS